jgi:hypothetical protein
MGSIGTKKSSNDFITGRLHKKQARDRSVSNVFFSPTNMRIQPKATCACGGDCPRCDEKLPRQTQPRLSNGIIGHQFSGENTCSRDWKCKME